MGSLFRLFFPRLHRRRLVQDQTQNSTNNIRTMDADANILLQQGLAYSGKLHFAQAIVTFKDMTHKFPLDHRGFNNLGVSYLRSGHVNKAFDMFSRARELAPTSSEVSLNYALALRGLNRINDAIEALFSFQDKNGTQAELACTVANLFSEIGKSKEAIDYLQRLTLTQPPSSLIYYTLGMVALTAGQKSESVAWLDEALKLDVRHVPSIVARGRLLRTEGDLVAAQAHFDAALRVDPSNPDARFNRGLIQLSLRQFQEGWEDYDFRQYTDEHPTYAPNIPIWQITDPIPKCLLVIPEQGLGDEIMFASCIPDLIREVPQVVLGCDMRLAPLFQRSFQKVELQPFDRKLNDLSVLTHKEGIDCQVAIGSLPRRFRKNSAAFPVRKAYLEANGSLVREWKEKFLRLGRQSKVGITWRGGLNNTQRDLRTIPRSLWNSIFAQPHLRFISLQYDATSDEIALINNEHNISIAHYPESLRDIDETAALICACDLIISVPTAFAHLGGALGVDTWILTPASPDWRYEHQGDRILWYPSVRLFRQSPDSSWHAVLNEVAQTLANHFSSSRNG